MSNDKPTVHVMPKKPEPAVHLGDGAYAAYDGFQFELYASDGVTKTGSVYLDPWALQALVQYARRCNGRPL